MSAGSGLQQFRLRENQLFLVLSIVIGILAGLLAVLFTLGIERASRVMFGVTPSALRLFFVPSLVSVVTGILLVKVFHDARGSGVPQTVAAFRLHGGVISPRVPIGKFITGILCIGSGHSLGREGPSLQLGAGLASVVGQWLRLSPARVKELVPVGAAGALSAAFNTPVAAVIFALEEVIGDMNATLLGSTVVASVASVVVARSILGNEPLFRVPAYQLVHPAELAAYALLGLVGGVISVVFCRLLLRLRTYFMSLPPRTRLWQPAMGGVAIGAILILVPEVRGVGYPFVDQALNGGLVLKTMLLLGSVKLVATVVSYASGNAGGIFAPSLFIGAMTGGAIGLLVQSVAPFPTGAPGAYALVGMGALFAGIIRAPMTSVFMIFEITQDYQILVPLMVANLLSFTISRRYQPQPVYHALLQQDGVHLPSADPTGSGGGWTAGDVMLTEPRFVDPNQTVEEAWGALQDDAAGAWLVGAREHLVGVISREQLEGAMNGGRALDAVSALAVDSPEHVHSDHPVEVVLERLASGEGVLPVVSRHDGGRVEGAITLADVTRFVGKGRRRPAAGD